MGRKQQVLSFTILLLLVFLGGCFSKSETGKLTIATAANVQFAMQELVEEFTKETGIETEVIQGSSGKLVAQIKEGAPYDVFVSADMKYPQTLYSEGSTLQKPRVFGFGKLVLWTTKDIKPTLEMLSSTAIKHIALPNPKTAPYGLGAKELLQHYNLHDSLKNKFVFGESVAQTTQFISSGAADIGFTAISVVLSPQIKSKGKWLLLDTAAYTPIAQGAVVIKQENKSTEDAQAFYQFLFSDNAKTILTRYGYSSKEEF